MILLYFVFAVQLFVLTVISEDEFLGVIGTKVLRVFLLAIHSHLYTETSVLRTLKICQKPQRNCTFINQTSACKNIHNLSYCISYKYILQLQRNVVACDICIMCQWIRTRSGPNLDTGRSKIRIQILFGIRIWTQDEE